MGIIKRGILGGFSNKVANVVGSSWKGINTMRALPLSVANPRTAAQVDNRNSFSYFSKIGSDVLSTIVQPLLNRDAKYMSGYNKFIKLNKTAYDLGGLDGWKLNPVISDGVLSATITNATVTAGQTSVTISAPTTLANAKDSATDKMFACVIEYPTADADLSNAKAYGVGGSVARSAGSISVPVPTITAGHTYVVMLAYRSADGVETSETAVSENVIA